MSIRHANSNPRAVTTEPPREFDGANIRTFNDLTKSLAEKVTSEPPPLSRRAGLLVYSPREVATTEPPPLSRRDITPPSRIPRGPVSPGTRCGGLRSLRLGFAVGAVCASGGGSLRFGSAAGWRFGRVGALAVASRTSLRLLRLALRLPASSLASPRSLAAPPLGALAVLGGSDVRSASGVVLGWVRVATADEGAGCLRLVLRSFSARLPLAARSAGWAWSGATPLQTQKRPQALRCGTEGGGKT